MALIRGVNSLFPCPRCLISGDKQGDISARAPLRTEAATKATIKKAREQRLAGDKEEILKGTGLRDVDVCPCYRYPCFMVLLTTSLTECFLEDQQLGPTRYIIFRSAPYFAGRPISTTSLGTPQRDPRETWQGGLR